MRKNRKAIRFTASYVLFTIIFMVSSMTLAVIAQGSAVFTSFEDNTDNTGIINNNEDSKPHTPFLLMIDAGHGGEDGGAVGIDGTLEKHLNLAVAENISDLSLLFGLKAVMTREDDSLLYDKYEELKDYDGQKKALDLKNRLRMAEEECADLFLSIHMNKYSSSAYSGLQVFYSPNTNESRVLADAVKTYNTAHLQPDNQREAKAATSSIYLLHRLQIPSLLVECGFLSNQAECSLLETESYRCSLACTLIVPILEYSVRVVNN